MNGTTSRGGACRPFLRLLSDRINAGSEALLFALMTLMILVTTAQVLCRFFFESLAWSEELTCFLLVFASLVGTAVGFKRGSHMTVSFLTSRLPEGGRKALGILSHLLGIFFFGVVAWYGALLVQSEAFQRTPALGISMGWIYAMYPLVGGAILVHLASGVLEIWMGE